MSLKTRSEIPLEETWNLADIFPSDEEWEKSYLQVEHELDEFHIGAIALDSAKGTLKTLERYDRLMEKYNRTSSYAFYKYSEDGTDPENQTMVGRSQTLGKKSFNLSTNLVNLLLQLPKEVIQSYISEEKDLENYHRFLEKIEEIRDHSLTPEMEDLLASLNHTLNTPNSIYLTVTASDLKFEPVKDKSGNEVPVSLFMYMTQIETSPDTELRRNAYQSLTDGLKKYQHGLAQSLSSEINKNVSIAKLRNYPTTMDYLLQYSTPAANHFYAGDGVSTAFFEDVLDTFQQELSPHMQRYARLRKRQLGLDKLLFSDVKAPLDPEFDPPITYKEAGEIIVEAVGVLGTEYQEQMRKAFTDRWVYRGDNVGRRMIAFGGGVHGVHGYSFYPWGGNLFDMLLLGHELGHALHFTLSSQNKKIINDGASLLFVEAPSTLVEHLIVNYLKGNRDDPRLHRWLNMYSMMSYHHNCVTHILEAELLRRLYKMADKKIPLTTAVISNTKGAILSDFWGDTVELDEGAKLTWMRQPHYYMGLYPFTYSIGTSASTVIANRIKTEGSAVGEQWTNVLKLGGSMSGLDLYKQAGLDMSTMDVIKQAIAHVGRIVDELEESF
ncbi:oligoendopeptidase F [Anaerobacillus sp. CMMVII]|uniref:M3 family metallopeptidase n=1 Tax=Anaerobacillus sp. CMMVII TaxID=2755588 RepID=UPI0021B744DD|nr:M3 family metallopeptidase [Anaerobacillus sp. CMMVII]MCT8137825.1 oligoendopeptidase F [Anaerobacillus sp. CMMVII]